MLFIFLEISLEACLITTLTITRSTVTFVGFMSVSPTITTTNDNTSTLPTTAILVTIVVGVTIIIILLIIIVILSLVTRHFKRSVTVETTQVPCTTQPTSQPVYDEVYSVVNKSKPPEVPLQPFSNDFEMLPMFSDDLCNPIYDQGALLSGDVSNTIQNEYNDEYVDVSGESIYAVPKKTCKIFDSNLHVVSQLGVGEFGEVLLAETVNLSLKDLNIDPMNDDRTVSLQVAVKMIKHGNDSSFESINREIKFMSQLNHENVVKLLAISHHDSTEHFIVMEYMENGDLSEYLLSHDFTTKHPPPLDHQISPQILLSMCIQVANGMAYLASCNYIHRDLAARNCLVGEDNTIKIADFGLSRDLHDSAYYWVRGKAKMPVRWMSYECFYGKFSEKSDVWAYGVTVWEIYTMGQEGPPYSKFSDQEVVEDALKGKHRTLLSKPTSCPHQVYDIIKTSCWESESHNRASFDVIYNELVKLQTHLY